MHDDVDLRSGQHTKFRDPACAEGLVVYYDVVDWRNTQGSMYVVPPMEMRQLESDPRSDGDDLRVLLLTCAVPGQYKTDRYHIQAAGKYCLVRIQIRRADRLPLHWLMVAGITAFDLSRSATYDWLDRHSQDGGERHHLIGVSTRGFSTDCVVIPIFEVSMEYISCCVGYSW